MLKKFLKISLTQKPTIVILIICITPLLSALAQVNQTISDVVKDSIVARFNRNDFKGIYMLADTSFTKKISESRLVNYLRGNRNSGNIVGIKSQTELRGGISYHLELEARDLNLFLQVTPTKKFSSFGISNVAPQLLAVCPPVKNDNPLRSKMDIAIDSLVREYFRDPNATGLSIGLIKDGKKIIYNYGETQKGKGQLPNSHTVYEIGSITKTFITTILAQAIIDKKVTLTDDITRFLPDSFPNLSYQGQPITLQHLANHTSRLPTLPQNIGEQANFNPLTPEQNYDTILFFKALHEIKLDTLPGYKFEYSNWGIALLGYIMEKVYNQPLGTLLNKYIFVPLKMQSSGYKLSPSDKEKMALVYSENGKQVAFQEGGCLGPAGDIHSSTNDMLHYLEAQLSEKHPIIKLTHEPTKNGIGLGWGIRTNGIYRELQHNGSTQGSTANLTAFPELNSGCFIVVNNRTNIGRLIVGIQKIIKQPANNK
ncbi:serine hydrolase [Runella sp. SP2]|uniref:serine hydrolase domain-containing protein n=1 Tax=Runella sp. SP2 TaxID=2268026 RepID=UPI000F08CAE7|nr:serine hydrolase domain-containing protein [Runella sp. SP2]AYQ31486.1 class A beta-lactamase-related serine hydrolase [Runella sp. SP2]